MTKPWQGEAALTVFTKFSEAHKHHVSSAPGAELPVDDMFIELSACRALTLFLKLETDCSAVGSVIEKVATVLFQSHPE